MDGCVFCGIAGGAIPSRKIFEDEQVIAIYDIRPQAPTHILVMPKTHIKSAASIDASNSGVVARIFEVIAELAARPELGLLGGFRVIANAGADAGQTVDHLHFHVLGGKSLGERLL